jgi:hypothetical protein
MVVDFFIVGAAKCGTTTLADYLAEHPGVCFSPIKEPNYFAADIRPEKFSKAFKQNLGKSVDEYFEKDFPSARQIAFVQKESDYERLFSPCEGKQIKGEASTSYLYSEAAAEEIFRHNPKAKIVYILRNPLERLRSHYGMALKYGFVKGSLMEEVKIDMARVEKGWGVSELFVELGLYAEQIERYHRLFPKEQILALRFEDLKTNPQQVYRQLCDFLEIDFQEGKSEASNPSGRSRMPGLNYLLTQWGIKKAVARLLPDFVSRRMKKLYYTSVNLPPLSEEEKAFLAALYEDNIKRTSTISGLQLDHWLKS